MKRVIRVSVIGRTPRSRIDRKNGMIDPRDSRRVLGFGLAMAEEGDNRKVRPVSFGVGRI